MSGDNGNLTLKINSAEAVWRYKEGCISVNGQQNINSDLVSCNGSVVFCSANVPNWKVIDTRIHHYCLLNNNMIRLDNILPYESVVSLHVTVFMNIKTNFNCFSFTKLLLM